MKKVHIGNILKNMRNINTKLSQKEMGELLSTADTTISSYEREKTQPDFETIVNYAENCDFEIKLYNKKTGEEISVEDMSKEL